MNLKLVKHLITFISSAILLIVTGEVFGQNAITEWAKKTGNAGNELGQSICVDQSENVYITGNFHGNCDFDPGLGVFNLSSIGASGINDIFIQKLDSAGNFIWARRFGDIGFDYGTSISTDKNGNVYTVGYFQNKVDFDPGPDSAFLNCTTGSDGFILKLDSGGNFLWVKQITSSFEAFPQNIKVDAQNNVLITGNFNGTTDFDPSSNTAIKTSFGGYDSFIEKLDSNGNLLWIKRLGSTGDDFGTDIDFDPAGNTYSIGYFRNTLSIDSANQTKTYLSNGSSDIYILKLDSTGEYSWLKQIGGTSVEWGLSLSVDANRNIYATGAYTGNVDFDPDTGVHTLAGIGNRDIFILKLDSNGHHLWARSAAGSGLELGQSIAVDLNGNPIITGYFSGTVAFDTANIDAVRVAGGYDIYILKLISDGSFEWVKQIGGTGSDHPRSINISSRNQIYITGYFNGTTDFDPGPNSITYTALGNWDMFTFKMEYCLPINTFHQVSACDSFIWVDGQTYYTSNQSATWTYINSSGCDSIVRLDLTLNTSTSSIDSVIACDSFTWIDNVTYTSSNNSANKIFQSTDGCDSIVSLYLTILKTSQSVHTHQACDSFSWIDGITYTASTNSATHILQNSAGCDSIVTLNLTILNSSQAIHKVSSCDSFLWIDGVNYTASTNTPTHTLQNAAGCDSVITLDLTINSVQNKLITRVGRVLFSTNSNASYQWLDCNLGYNVIPGAQDSNFLVTQDGNYAVELTEMGCKDTSQCIQVSITGINEQATDNYSILFYPNPFFSSFTIKLEQVEAETNVVIKNSVGQVVLKSTFQNSSDFEIELNEPPGFYFVIIDSGNGVGKTIKVLKSPNPR
ncbi:MAG: T9SS type A sorting domain-containing protein [Bacteroidetes bacterium]|nr:MAG: T9SS type A sorting domain-containing protein [Bacteroidota bacterium]